jgi:hypothetical protein
MTMSIGVVYQWLGLQSTAARARGSSGGRVAIAGDGDRPVRPATEVSGRTLFLFFERTRRSMPLNPPLVQAKASQTFERGFDSHRPLQKPC